jgi:hypothetical protein
MHFGTSLEYQSDMILKTLQVWRLTLALSAPPMVNISNKEKGEDVNILDREKMARAVEITVTTGALCRRVDSIHGVEPGSWSRFWAIGAKNEVSEEESEEEDSLSSLILIKEALHAGFTIDQLRSVEEGLVSPSLSSTKVTNPSNHLLYQQNFDVWMEKQRKKGSPW